MELGLWAIVGRVLGPGVANWLHKNLGPPVKKELSSIARAMTKPGTATAEQQNNPMLIAALRLVELAEKRPLNTVDTALLAKVHALLLDCHSKRDVYLLRRAGMIAAKCWGSDTAWMTADEIGLSARSSDGGGETRGFIATTLAENARLTSMLATAGLATKNDRGFSIAKTAADRIADMVGHSQRAAFITADQWDEEGYVPLAGPTDE